MAEWNCRYSLQEWTIFMGVIFLNQTVLIDSAPMKGNTLRCNLYIYIIKMFCSHIRQMMYATMLLHTNNLIVWVIKFINHQIIITAFSALRTRFCLYWMHLEFKETGWEKLFTLLHTPWCFKVRTITTYLPVCEHFIPAC